MEMHNVRTLASLFLSKQFVCDLFSINIGDINKEESKVYVKIFRFLFKCFETGIVYSINGNDSFSKQYWNCYLLSIKQLFQSHFGIAPKRLTSFHFIRTKIEEIFNITNTFQTTIKRLELCVFCNNIQFEKEESVPYLTQYHLISSANFLTKMVVENLQCESCGNKYIVEIKRISCASNLYVILDAGMKQNIVNNILTEKITAKDINGNVYSYKTQYCIVYGGVHYWNYIIHKQNFIEVESVNNNIVLGLKYIKNINEIEIKALILKKCENMEDKDNITDISCIYIGNDYEIDACIHQYVPNEYDYLSRQRKIDIVKNIMLKKYKSLVDEYRIKNTNVIELEEFDKDNDVDFERNNDSTECKENIICICFAYDDGKTSFECNVCKSKFHAQCLNVDDNFINDFNFVCPFTNIHLNHL